MTPPDADITELPSSPGARLRREREAQGLTEQQAAESLNLDPAVVVLIESNEFSTLGAPVFVKGHLRRYASLLGLAEDEIVGAYERSKSQIGEPTLVPKSRLEMMPTRGRQKWPWVVGGAAAFLLAAAGVAYLTENGLPWAGDADEDAALSTALGTPDGPALPAAEPAPQADAAIQQQSAEPTPAMTPEAAGAAAPAPFTSATGTPAAPLAPGQVSLQLRFTTDSWVEIFDGSGKAVLYDLGKAGTERSVTATAPLSVTLGNAPGVAIAVNGRALPPPPRSPDEAVARFSIGPDGSLR